MKGRNVRNLLLALLILPMSAWAQTAITVPASTCTTAGTPAIVTCTAEADIAALPGGTVIDAKSSVKDAAGAEKEFWTGTVATLTCSPMIVRAEGGKLKFSQACPASYATKIDFTATRK